MRVRCGPILVRDRELFENVQRRAKLGWFLLELYSTSEPLNSLKFIANAFLKCLKMEKYNFFFKFGLKVFLRIEACYKE